jgi:hypothetical protein
MLDQLTQEQIWGMEYLRKIHNEQAESSNATLEQRNRFVPRDQPLEEPKPLLTPEEFALRKLSESADMGYQQLLAAKEQEALRLFREKSPAKQAALLAQLNVPDVLPHE